MTVTLPGGPLVIEWRDDGHVMMTGPVETEFDGTIDPSTLVLDNRQARRRLMPVDVLTFGCRLNTSNRR